MARLHSGRKGKSGSKKPISKTAPEWLSYKPEEIEAIIVKLAKQEKAAAQIGLILRDTYGVPDVRLILKKRIGQVLKANNLAPAEPEAITALKKREARALAHAEMHKKDMMTKRGLQLIRSKIRRLAKHVKKPQIQ